MVILDDPYYIGDMVNDPIGQHFLVKFTGISNFCCSRMPVQSLINFNGWKQGLENYWDKQLIHVI